MKTILVDLNIVLDYLEDRDGSEKAGEIFTKCYEGDLKGYICAHEITTLAYFLGKSHKSRMDNMKIISQILKLFHVIEIGKTILEKALHSNIMDYEDAVIVESAIAKKISCIITRNTKDYKNSSIPAVLPEDFLAQFT